MKVCLRMGLDMVWEFGKKKEIQNKSLVKTDVPHMMENIEMIRKKALEHMFGPQATIIKETS